MTTTSTTDQTTYQWLVMHDDPAAEGWVGEFNGTNALTCDEYTATMHAAQQPGAVITIDPAWLQPDTTASPDPTGLPGLDMSDGTTPALLEYTRDTGVLLRVTPLTTTSGTEVVVRVDAVHDLFDIHALPGSPLRRVIDFFHHGTPAHPHPGDELWMHTEVDGFGDDAHRADRTPTHYERAADSAQARCAELGLEADWGFGCNFPTEMLYAVAARHQWTGQGTEHWTPHKYARIAGRFEKAFGLPLHPDDPLPILAPLAVPP